jgi:hypothetical protein
VLAFTVQQLLGAVSLHESWSSELSYTLPRPVLAKCLFNARRNLPKLWYLAVNGLAYKSPLEEVIAMDTFTFYNLYGPTWVKWLDRNKSRFWGWSAGDVAFAGWRQEVAQVPSSGGHESWEAEQQEVDSSGVEEGQEEVGGLDARRRRDMRLLQQLLGTGKEGGSGEEEQAWEGESSLEEADSEPASSDEVPAAFNRGPRMQSAAAAHMPASAGGAGAGFQFPMTWLSDVGRAQGVALAAQRLYGSQEGSLLVWPQDFLAAGRGRDEPRR